MNKAKTMKQAKSSSGRMNFWERNRRSNGYLLKKTVGSVLYKILRALLLFGLCFLILQPLVNKLTISFMEEQDLYDATVISIPRNFSLGNYKLAGELIGYQSGIVKTFIMAMVVAILQVISATLVGYGFARYKFPFKNFWFACVMATIIIPPQTIMSSLYFHFKFFDVFGIIELITGSPLNLLNSTAPYLMMAATCMGLKSGLYIYMLRQYFRNAPKELEEAAYVDGCGRLKTFVRIMLPDATPMLTSCFLFAFVWQWTDSFYASLFLRKLQLLPFMLRGLANRLNDYYEVNYGTGNFPTIGYQQALIATGVLMVIAPLILLYLIAQKGFVESLSQSGIKM